MPEEFPTIDAEIESLVRALIAEKCNGVEGVGHVFTEPFYISGKQQYVALLGVQHTDDSNAEVRYLLIEFAGFEDTAKGCEEAPVYNLNYTLRAVQEFVHAREDNSSSANDFAALVMKLRAAFLTGRDLGHQERLWHDPLQMTRRAALEDDEMTSVFAHTAPFLIKVEVVPSG